jgi:hypothetical protein
MSCERADTPQHAARPSERYTARGTRARSTHRGTVELCATCARTARTEAKAHRRGRHVERTYGITSEMLRVLHEYQGGRCWICQVADGTAKALATDHNHRTGEVRGLLCGPCNQMLGRLRDSPVAFFRAALYLIWPPSRDAWRQK